MSVENNFLDKVKRIGGTVLLVGSGAAAADKGASPVKAQDVAIGVTETTPEQQLDTAIFTPSFLSANEKQGFFQTKPEDLAGQTEYAMFYDGIKISANGDIENFFPIEQGSELYKNLKQPLESPYLVAGAADRNGQPAKVEIQNGLSFFDVYKQIQDKHGETSVQLILLVDEIGDQVKVRPMIQTQQNIVLDIMPEGGPANTWEFKKGTYMVFDPKERAMFYGEPSSFRADIAVLPLGSEAIIELQSVGYASQIGEDALVQIEDDTMTAIFTRRGKVNVNIPIVNPEVPVNPSPAPSPAPEAPTPEEVVIEAAVQMTAEELQQLEWNDDGERADYVTGIKVMINGKPWEFVSSVPGVSFDAATTDVAILTDRINKLILGDNPDITKYTSPSTQKIRVMLTRDNTFIGNDTDVVGVLNDWYGFTRAFVSEDGVLIHNIPYTDSFINFMKQPQNMPDDNAWTNTFMGTVFQQIYYSGRINPSYPKDGFIGNLIKDLGLPPTPTGDQLVDAYRGIGITRNKNIYP